MKSIHEIALFPPPFYHSHYLFHPISSLFSIHNTEHGLSDGPNTYVYKSIPTLLLQLVFYVYYKLANCTTLRFITEYLIRKITEYSNHSSCFDSLLQPSSFQPTRPAVRGVLNETRLGANAGSDDHFAHPQRLKAPARPPGTVYSRHTRFLISQLKYFFNISPVL